MDELTLPAGTRMLKYKATNYPTTTCGNKVFWFRCILSPTGGERRESTSLSGDPIESYRESSVEQE
jgi:hypothetical protein